MPKLTPIDQEVQPSFDYSAFSLPENVSLTFHLNPHLTAEDLPDPSDLRTIIRRADIVIPEFVHSPSTKNVLARIAMGGLKDYEYFRSLMNATDSSDWIQAMVSSLYASRVATANIDIGVDHPAVRAFIATESNMLKVTNDGIRSHFDDVLDKVTANFLTVKARDQQILQNLTPEIEMTIANNRKLSLKRDNEALDVRIFYGSTHRSLLDAVVAKHATSHRQGFSALASEDSITNDIVPSVYGKYLRGQNIEVEDIERIFAYNAFGAFVHNKRYLGNNPSARLLTSTFIDLEDELDATDLRHLLEQTKNHFES